MEDQSTNISTWDPETSSNFLNIQLVCIVCGRMYKLGDGKGDLTVKVYIPEEGEYVDTHVCSLSCRDIYILSKII